VGRRRAKRPARQVTTAVSSTQLTDIYTMNIIDIIIDSDKVACGDDREP
jgi:hypothetical protein